ncbi:hypothetical protein, partial [Streptomyces sp. NPDC002758]
MKHTNASYGACLKAARRRTILVREYETDPRAVIEPVGSRPVADLVGRRAEWELVKSLLEGDGRVGPGLLLRGDPGV